MTRAALLTILLSSLILIGTTSQVWAAQIDARINPSADESSFELKYQKTLFIEYPQGGNLFDLLQNKEWTVSGTADATNPGVQDLMNKLNQKLRSDGSHTQISDLKVDYEFHLKGRNISTSVDYKVVLDGKLTNYVITKDQVKTLVDMGWRGMTIQGPVIINDVNINQPISVIQTEEPEAYSLIQGTDAETLLLNPIIDAEFIKDQPLSNWHFLFDPTGINVDASTFGLSSEIQGFVVSSYTMGESSIREGRQVERIFTAEFTADKPYAVRTVQSSDQGTIRVIGFAAIDKLEGVEIVGVTPKAPEGYATTSTGEFPVMIVYGMAGMAAVGGGIFFFISSRALKKEAGQGQRGIDPSRLVGYQTSASAGGYQTNRGEAQLRDDSDYARHRSVYDEQSQQSPPPPQISSSVEEATCGCATSAEMGSECDCEMQGSCLCDTTCSCKASVCKEHVKSMR